MDLNERSFREWFILLLGSLAAIEVGSIVVSWNTPDLAIVGAVIAALAWILWAGDSWWVPVFVGATVGGSFVFSFKIFPSDIGLAMAFIGLAPLLLLGQPNLFQNHRRFLTAAFYLLPLYIVARVGFSMHDSPAGAGNMLRVMANILWPFAFGQLFYAYAKTSLIPRMVGAILCFTTLRVIAVYIGLILGTIIYIPGLNYVVGLNAGSSIDVRGCAYFLVTNFLFLYQATRNALFKLILAPLALSAAYLVLFGGGRFETATFPLLPLAFAVATRRWLLFFGTLSAAVLVFLAVNMFPSSLDKAPPVVARSLSILLVKSGGTELQRSLESSDLWHHSLQHEGFVRWSASPETILFGANLKPYHGESYLNLGQTQEDEMRVSASADLGYYESGLWTVLGTLGLTGYLLYLFVFIWLWRFTIPYLARHPVKTLKDGIVFWGTYASMFWYVTADAAGSYPSLELALMIVAAALVQDMAKESPQILPEAKSVPTFSPGLSLVR